MSLSARSALPEIIKFVPYIRPIVYICTSVVPFDSILTNAGKITYTKLFSCVNSLKCYGSSVNFYLVVIKLFTFKPLELLLRGFIDNRKNVHSIGLWIKN
jgi:hypothetical protein